MEQNFVLFSKRSGKDFSRKSKLSFTKTISILLAMQGKTISDELLNFFDYKLDTTSASEVNETYKGFRFLAVDGSAFSVPLSKDALHLNAVYDIQNKIYLDSIVENVKVCDEQSALNQMIMKVITLLLMQ